MSRLKKWFSTVFSCIKQDEGQFSGELVCSYPTLIIPENVQIPSSRYTPAPNVIRVEEKEEKAKDFLPVEDSVERTDDIPSPMQVDVDTKFLRNDEEEEYEAPSFRQFITKKESRKNEEENIEQARVHEDEGFSFWHEENILKQNSDFSRMEEEHQEQDDEDDEESVPLKDLWINQESENQPRKDGDDDDDQIPAELMLEEIQNQIKPTRLSFNGRSTSRSILMDPSVDFSAGFSIRSSSSCSTSSSQNKKKLRFRVEDCCLSNQIRKADVLLSMLRLKNRVLKVASRWARDNAGIENRSNGKAALKTFFSVAD